MEITNEQKELIEDIKMLPETIAKKETELIKVQLLINDSKEVYENKKSKLMLEITADKDLVTGKNTYSNPESRSAELNNRLIQDVQASIITEGIKSNTEKKSNLEIEIACLHRKFHSSIVILEFFSSFKK